MGKLKTFPWDPAEDINTAEDVAVYLKVAFEDGDPQIIAAVLGDIARSKGMTDVARKAGLGRESLYKALSPEGNPELATVLKVLGALGLKLQVVPASTNGEESQAHEVGAEVTLAATARKRKAR